MDSQRRMSFVVSDEDFASIRAIAAAMQVGVSAVVRWAVREYIDSHTVSIDTATARVSESGDAT